jgi:hypothetical protein
MVTRAAITALAGLLLMAAGCSSQGALRDGRYAEVKPEQLRRAGESETPHLAAPIQDLLLDWCRNPASVVTEAQAIEAAIALGQAGGAANGPSLLEAAGTRRGLDVRYFAVESLAAVDPGLLRQEAPRLLASEDSPLVRAAIERHAAAGGR